MTKTRKIKYIKKGKKEFSMKPIFKPKKYEYYMQFGKYDYSTHTPYSSYFAKNEWDALSRNPYVIDLLKDNLDKISWYWLSQNSGAIELLENNLDNVNWMQLSRNPNAIHILEKNLDKVDWHSLSSNPNAIHILEKNWDKINRSSIYGNENAIKIIEKLMDNYEKDMQKCFLLYRSYPLPIRWDMLSSNPNAIHLLEQNFHEVSWSDLSSNPSAIHLLENNMDKIDWFALSANPNAIHLLEKKKFIYGKALAYNPNAIHLVHKYLYRMSLEGLLDGDCGYHKFVLQIDYEKQKLQMEPLKKELLEYVFHPLRLRRLCDKLSIDLVSLVNQYN